MIRLLAIWVVMVVGGVAWGLDQAKPGGDAAGSALAGAVAPGLGDEAGRREIRAQLLAQDRGEFARRVDLGTLRLLAVQHRDQVKILDSWARQSLATIRHRQRIDGEDPLYTALDMCFRPEVWAERNIVYVRDVPLRQRLARLVESPAEQQRILREATVAPELLRRAEVQGMLQRISADTLEAQAVGRVRAAEQTFTDLWSFLHAVPPARRGAPWEHPLALQGNVPETVARLAPSGLAPPAVPGYSTERSREIVLAFAQLANGWRSNNVEQANAGIKLLARALPAVGPQGTKGAGEGGAYPGAFTRQLELWYNRTFHGTVGVFAYLAAMTLFLLAATGALRRARGAALGLLLGAVAFHAAAMAVRWWLAGRIPIQNQFESVLGAAFFGCALGLGLEWWWKNNLFGLAMSFVGALAMTACWVFPFVLGADMGAAIAPVAGILGDYWLYIHVNVVIWSYALIGGSFVLGAAYLLTQLAYWMAPVAVGAGAGVAASDAGATSRRGAVLERIDAANMVILQLAFWFLGAGIICGAIWADHSWGRPWGWDPKETFALVTWIVYLLIVHLRFVSGRNRAMWTAGLAVAGFFVMLFNWIGVNFWLVGLHSYA